MTMKNMFRSVSSPALLTLAIGMVSILAPSAHAAGVAAARTDSVHIARCMYAVANKTVLITANSSDPRATLSAYTPSGKYLGWVQNGGGARYGGTVFWVGGDPKEITIKSSSGGSAEAKTTPYHP